MPARRSGDPPVQSLTVFLLKRGTTRYVDALEDAGELTGHPLKSSLLFKGKLFVAPQSSGPPRWVSFLSEGSRGELQQLYNASTSAVLFVRAAQRMFALTFGYGRSLLNPERIERSFGLRVVLNTVDEGGLRNVDTKTVQELTVHTRRQVSRASRLAEFGIDKQEDVLGSVAGVPRDRDFARMVSGADALRFRAPVAFKDLGSHCRAALTAYRADAYKQRGFEFVDHVRTVRDPAVVEALDDDLVEALVSGDVDGMHMAPPEVIDWNATEGFSFAKDAGPDADLTLASFFDQIRRPDDLSPERLRRQKVYRHSDDDPKARPAWPVYRALVAERSRQGQRYVLSGGSWYEVDRTFAQSIENRVARIRSARLGLPKAREAEVEADYNSRAGHTRGIYNIDRRCPRVEGDPIELCDLYSSGRQFVHVKRWKASSTLSHLFAQARTSAEAFLYDGVFREQARRLLRGQARSLEGHVPFGRPDPSKYKIVFAIIKGGAHGWRRTLPFFSQLHLTRVAEALRRMGFEVRLERVGIE